MTPLEIMEALRDVPEDLIDIDYENLSAFCAADQTTRRKETAQPDAESLPELITVHRESFLAERSGTGTPENGKRMRGSTILSYLMTACCTAACIGGIAVLLCMTKLSSNYSVQPQDTGVTPLQPTVTMTAAAAFPNTATTASVLHTEFLSGIRNTDRTLTAEPLPYTEQTEAPDEEREPFLIKYGKDACTVIRSIDADDKKWSVKIEKN